MKITELLKLIHIILSRSSLLIHGDTDFKQLTTLKCYIVLTFGLLGVVSTTTTTKRGCARTHARTHAPMYIYLYHHIHAAVNIGIGGQYRGADKFLVRPGRKQATATEDFEFLISYL